MLDASDPAVFLQLITLISGLLFVALTIARRRR